jgi:uncharacterized membrane protein YdjX (TVP38/TMEM64 family)
MQKKRIFIIVAAVLVILGLYYGGLKDWVSLQGLKENSHYFKDMVTRNYWFSAMIYVAAYTLAMAASLPVVAPFTLLGGFLFGMMGAFFALFSAVCGSMIYVMIFRHFLYDSMHEQFKDQLAQFKQNITIHGKSYVLILHYLAVVPFFMINTLAALADFSLFDVFWTTIVGNTPLFLLLAYQGRELAHIESVSDIFSPHFIIALGLLVVLAFMPIIIKRFRARNT